MSLAEDLLAIPRDVLNARRVYGDVIEKDGVTVVPAAFVVGGGGAGEGRSDEDEGGEGEGGGFGTMSRAVGVYVIRDGSVEWRPAVDVTVLGVAGIALAALMTMTIGSVLRRRARAG